MGAIPVPRSILPSLFACVEAATVPCDFCLFSGAIGILPMIMVRISSFSFFFFRGVMIVILFSFLFFFFERYTTSENHTSPFFFLLD